MVKTNKLSIFVGRWKVNKKSQGRRTGGAILVIIAIVVIYLIFSDSDTPTEQPPSEVSSKARITLSFDKSTIKPSDSTRLSVQITNLEDIAIDGNVSVKAIDDGNKYVSIDTSEDTHIYLANKSSKAVLIYTVTGISSITVEPYLVAVINIGDGEIFKSDPKKLRIEVNPS